MASPIVSVILPFFNAEATLAKAILSIRQQTLPDWELIAFDDGSIDASRTIAERFAREDSRIRVLGERHVGIVEALRRGCDAAHSPYLARMDADDIAAPERLEKQLALLESDPEMAVCGTLVRIVGEMMGSGRRRYEKWINSLFNPEDIVRELFVECPLPHPTFFIRRSAYDHIGGYQGQDWPEDHDLLMRIWLAGYQIGKVPEILLDWTDASTRLSMSDPRYSEAAFRAIKRYYLFESYLKNRPIFHQWGAGEVGKRWLREWNDRRPFAVVDIHPRKIGRKIHGCRIIPPDHLPPPGSTFIVIAVGSPGAREDIRAWLNPKGYIETKDYLFLA
ncbi:MAG TPA: glycosyltransferase family 2 protein [Candidatus Hydrogenedentes bacterium]|nr:glycosyltransferase family 2 protein [Candidatus Hydrogenedentota bacterium]